MLINPLVDTRTYIEGIEVITPRGIPQRVEGVHDGTARRWLNRPDAPKPVARHEFGRKEVFWVADEAIEFIEKMVLRQLKLEELGKRVGRPRGK